MIVVNGEDFIQRYIAHVRPNQVIDYAKYALAPPVVAAGAQNTLLTLRPSTDAPGVTPILVRYRRKDLTDYGTVILNRGTATTLYGLLAQLGTKVFVSFTDAEGVEVHSQISALDVTDRPIAAIPTNGYTLVDLIFKSTSYLFVGTLHLKVLP